MYNPVTVVTLLVSCNFYVKTASMIPKLYSIVVEWRHIVNHMIHYGHNYKQLVTCAYAYIHARHLILLRPSTPQL